MNLINQINTKRLEIFFALFIFVFVALYISVAVPHDYRDVNRSPQWRMQHGWDEGQNVARAMSIFKYGYRNNPIISKDMNQFYLMFSAFGERFVSSAYDLPTRIVLFERLLATFSLSLCFIFFYLLCRMVTSTFPSFYAWLCFVSASWSYLPMGTSAKEDSFCVLLTICIFMCLISILKSDSSWKFYLSAILIGLGGATKQYPLILAIFFPIYFWKTKSSLKQALIRNLKMALLIVFFMLLASPNYFLSQHNFGTPLGLLLDQQSQSSVIGQMTDCWNIVKNILMQRYIEFYLALFLLACVTAKNAKFNPQPLKGFPFVKTQKWLLISGLTFYYVISIYKQSYYTSVRYFMIGEIFIFLMLAILVERLLQLKNIKLKLIVFSILLIEAFALNWRRGNFNFALQVSGAEQSAREAKNSVFDELATYLKSLDKNQTLTILSHWYVSVPPEFQPKYVNKIVMGYEAAEAYLGREYGFRLINEDLNKKLLEKERPTLFLSLNPLHEQNLSFANCFNLIHTIKAMQPHLYTNYISAIVQFHSTRRKLEQNEDPYPLPAGTTIYAFDTRNCF